MKRDLDNYQQIMYDFIINNINKYFVSNYNMKSTIDALDCLIDMLNK